MYSRWKSDKLRNWYRLEIKVEHKFFEPVKTAEWTEKCVRKLLATWKKE